MVEAPAVNLRQEEIPINICIVRQSTKRRLQAVDQTRYLDTKIITNLKIHLSSKLKAIKNTNKHISIVKHRLQVVDQTQRDI